MSDTKSNNPVPNFYRASAEDFKKIPGSPITYWLSDIYRDSFLKNQSLSEYFFSDGLTKTGNNDKFLRHYWEISHKFAKDPDRYRICAKGGEARNFYGNTDILVNWEPSVREHYRLDHVARITPEYLWNASGISWTKISSKGPTFRWFGSGMIAETAGPVIFTKKENDNELLLQTLGFLSSKVSWEIMISLNPTLSFQTNEVLILPFIIENTRQVCSIIDICIKKSKQDWDSYETSWDFTTLPLLTPEYLSPTIEASYQKIRSRWQDMTNEVQSLEEENNKIFIEAYGLEDELTPDVPLSEITLTCNPHYRYNSSKTEEELESLLLADTIKELISYAVGCMVGRYGLDKPGLILATQGETVDDYKSQIPQPSFKPDDDNIIPVLDDEYFTDDIVSRFKDFLKVVFGEKTLSQNLDYIAQALTGKTSSSPEKVIREYFMRDFFKDHLQRYKKRPIYWMFSSGKQQGFNTLVYMHRYNKTTLAKMRTDYLLELEAKLDAELNVLNEDVVRNKTRITKIKKQIEEMKTYDELLNNKALAMIDIDLDDGVVVNYAKFEGLVRPI